MDFSREAVRGLSLAPSGSTSVTYGPNRPALATSSWPLSGSEPSGLSPLGTLNSSSAFSGRQLVGRQVLGRVGALPVPLEVHPCPANPDHDVGGASGKELSISAGRCR